MRSENNKEPLSYTELAARLAAAVEEIAGHSEKQKKLATGLEAAHKENLRLTKQQSNIAAELDANLKELAFQNQEKADRAAELVVANKELAFQNKEKADRATELAVANKELAFQNEEKIKRAAELEHFLRTASGQLKSPGAVAMSMFSIPRRLILLMAGLTLAFSCGGYLLYRNIKTNTYAIKYAELKAIGELKAAGLSNWRQERLNNAAAFSVNPANEALVRPFLNNAASAQTAGTLRAWLESLINSYGYKDSALVDARGQLRLFVGPDKPKLSDKAVVGIKAVQRSQRPELSGIYDKTDGVPIPHLNLYAPLFYPGRPGEGRKCVGVLMFRIDPEKFLFPYIQSWPTASRTAETLLVTREGDNVVFLNKLRHSTVAPLSLRFPVSQTEVPAVQAVLGQVGAFEGNDYRGIQVLADLRPVPGTPWFIVSKVDSDEILSGLHTSAWLIAAFTGFCIFLSAALIALLYNVRQRNAYRNLSVVNAARLRSESLYGTLFSNMINGLAHCRMIYEADKPADVEYLAVNPAFGRLTGMKGAVGKRLTELIPGIRESNKELFEIYGRVASGGAPETFETWVEGLKSWLNISVYSPAAGEFVAVFEVITARKTAQAKQEENARFLREKNAELERFLYTASHDLKSPVVTVRSFLGYLEKDLADGNAARAAADMGFIRTAADKMAELIDDLLGISRVGRVMAPPGPVTLQAVADEALAAVAGRLTAGGVRAQVAGGAAALFGDRLRLTEIWQNLVENACKYMGPQKEPRVDIGFETRGAERVFFVRDNGMGIDPRFLVKIFGLFEKLDAKSEGSGVGLALVQRIVGLYGGRIWAESAGEGQGSCFYFTLPGAVSNEPRQGEKL